MKGGENLPSSDVMESHKKILFAALFLAILVPLFFTLALRSQFPLVSWYGDSPPDHMGASEYDVRLLDEECRGRHRLQHYTFR